MVFWWFELGRLHHLRLHCCRSWQHSPIVVYQCISTERHNWIYFFTFANIIQLSLIFSRLDQAWKDKYGSSLNPNRHEQIERKVKSFNVNKPLRTKVREGGTSLSRVLTWLRNARQIRTLTVNCRIKSINKMMLCLIETSLVPVKNRNLCLSRSGFVKASNMDK